jgi:hypothetical protein
MTNEATTLPPNPFEFTPIKDRKKLAGREADLAKIGKYLDSTASGSCPHIGLIGGRGVGKTSMLNAIEELAIDRKLLCLRIDLDENKASSPGKLWHEIYSELLEKTKSAGCWKGEGKDKFATYFALRKLLAGNSDVDQERIVLMFPYDLANTAGGLAQVECSSTTIKKDFEETLAELKRFNLKGVVLLIDEADCLGPSQSTLQQLRNLFQSSTLHGTSLVLAGTENIFSNIEEVFSPIPRQFHRIDVTPFKTSFDTRKLILRHLADCGQTHLMPPLDEIDELHVIAGGDPHEIQLYCHWMYQEVENGATETMRLLPPVFKGVMNEFVKSAGADAEAKAAIELIDNLTDDQLFRWIQYKEQSLDEIVDIITFTMALADSKTPSKKIKETIRQSMQKDFDFLHDTGLVKSPNNIELIGGPLTSAYYKAVFNLKTKKGGKFEWRDESASKIECDRASFFLASGTNSVIWSHIPDVAREPDYRLLTDFRNNKLSAKDTGKFSGHPVFDCTVKGRERGVKKACCLQLKTSKGQHEQLLEAYYLSKGSYGGLETKVKKWIKKHQSILDSRSISIEIVHREVWSLASDEEIWRIEHILGCFPLFGSDNHDAFGRSLQHQAIDKYLANDKEDAIGIFRQLISDSDKSYETRNNLAFILIEEEAYEEAIENLEKSLDLKYSHVAKHNLALVNALLGKKDDSIKQFEELWDSIESDSDDDDYGSSIMKILTSDLKKTTDVNKLPIDAATIMNLCVFGVKNREDTEVYLKEKYPDDYGEWLPHLP